jgi:hypothetical protein
VTAKTEVAIVASDPGVRTELATYLRSAGFIVHELEQAAAPHRAWSWVWIADRDLEPATADQQVRAWLRGGATARVVVVTAKLAAFRAVAADHEDRVVVLPAPVFGWHVVDALRPIEAPNAGG